MEKTNKFVDPMDKLYLPSRPKTRWQSFKDFIYNPEKGSCMGRTASSWAKITTFYIIFYAVLAGFWAVCMWGLLQSISDDRPTYQLDESIIGSSPGLASRPLNPEGRESIMTFSFKDNTWSNAEWPGLLGDFLREYENVTGNKCSFQGPNKLPCQVESTSWGNCDPDGSKLPAACIYFKINKVLEWKPSYYNDETKLPSQMPDSLKDVIKNTEKIKRDVVWLSCEGRSTTDKDNLGKITIEPSGFPGYYFPFRRQANYKSPVVAVNFENPKRNEIVDVECRSWAPNIHQDRKEQLAVLNFKLKFTD